MVGYFTITIKTILIDATSFSNTVKRKIARVGEQNEHNGNYTLSAYLIAQLGKKYTDNANKRITGNQLLTLALEKIKELQYMAGGMVAFLEAEENTKLMRFYESENGFIRFNTRLTKSDVEKNHLLVQLFKVI